MNRSTLIPFAGVLALYLGLKYLGGAWGAMVLYPLTLLVTILHEAGHSLGALLTGGSVLGMQINTDGSGYSKTAGGSMAITLLGGYLGSAILGNLMLHLALVYQRMATVTLYVLSAFMLFAAVVWFNSVGSSVLLVLFGAVLFIVANRRFFSREVLMFLGLSSILYIIQDFRTGPSSDLEMYARLFVWIPAQVWMYCWLLIVLLVTLVNIRLIWRNLRH